MLTILNIAFRNLIQAKRRTLLLGFAVALVAALFLILRTVSASVAERLIDSATTLSAGHVNVGGFFKVRSHFSNPILIDREGVRAFVEKTVPEAVSVIDRHRGWGRLISENSSINVGISGIVYAQEQKFFQNLRLAQENEYRPQGSDQVFGRFEDFQKNNSVVIFASQAKKLEVGVGDTLTFVTEASGSQQNTADLHVVAIASDLGFLSNWSLFAPRETVLELMRFAPNTTGAVMIYLPKAEMAEAVMARLRLAFQKRGDIVMDHDPNPYFLKFERVAGEDWLGQRLDLSIWSDEIAPVLWVTKALDLLSVFVIGILAFIIVGGIMNAMWMSVRERTKEIGTIRAIGAPKGFVVQIFLVEAVMLGLAASTVGTLLGTFLLVSINALHLPITSDGVRLFLMANTLQFNLQPLQFFSTLGLFSFITGLGALYPAFKASRLRPVEALMQGK